MPKPSHRKCIHCRERAVAPTTLPAYTTALEYDGRKYHVSVTDFHVLQCERVRRDRRWMIPPTSDWISRCDPRPAFSSPAEIRRNREALGLTRQQLADLLRISMFTLTHWETGTQIPAAPMNTLLRLFFQSGEARRILAVPGGIGVEAMTPIEEFVPAPASEN